MNILLLLNGTEGCQTGIEDGFSHLKSKGIIDSLYWFYLDDYAKKNSMKLALKESLVIAEKLQPTMIIIFHIGKSKISNEYMLGLRRLSSNPTLVYNEGDMYGTWAKPVTISMKVVMKAVDVVSICGLGKFYEQIYKINKKIIYTPNHADIARFNKKPFILEERKNKLVLVGNKVKPKLFSAIRRQPGAKQRESLINCLSDTFSKEFVLHGNGWDGLISNQGSVDFYQQLEVFKESWITVSYEHYPEIPYFFSNRLPIALLAGSLFVCHYNKGYENMFKGCDFIFFFKTNSEAIDLINYIHSLSKEDLLARSKRARKFSLKYFHPHVVWENFYNNVLALTKK